MMQGQLENDATTDGYPCHGPDGRGAAQHLSERVGEAARGAHGSLRHAPVLAGELATASDVPASGRLPEEKEG